MSDSVLVALLAFGGTSLGTVLGALVSSKVTDLRLQNLETQVKVIAKKQDDYITLDKRLLTLEVKYNEREGE
ncbi:MAG: hypothetical protein IKV80_07115 [Bacteroidales bacterium]|nr:hypothetical protein [Bacteroidales bacterium]